MSDTELYDQGKYEQKQHHCKNELNGVQYSVIALTHLTHTSCNSKVYIFEKENLLCFFLIYLFIFYIIYLYFFMSFQLWNTFFQYIYKGKNILFESLKLLFRSAWMYTILATLTL